MAGYFNYELLKIYSFADVCHRVKMLLCNRCFIYIMFSVELFSIMVFTRSKLHELFKEKLIEELLIFDNLFEK